MKSWSTQKLVLCIIPCTWIRYFNLVVVTSHTTFRLRNDDSKCHRLRLSIDFITHSDFSSSSAHNCKFKIYLHSDWLPHWHLARQIFVDQIQTNMQKKRDFFSNSLNYLQLKHNNCIIRMQTHKVMENWKRNVGGVLRYLEEKTIGNYIRWSLETIFPCLLTFFFFAIQNIVIVCMGNHFFSVFSCAFLTR